MTVLTEPYIPACPAVVEINFVPSHSLSSPPRRIPILPLLVYALHPIVLVAGLVPLILLGWLGFLFLQYPSSFGAFVFFAYLVLPLSTQWGILMGRMAYGAYFMRYGVHGIAKIKTDPPISIEVRTACTDVKVCDLSLRSIHSLPPLSPTLSPLVLFHPRKPTRNLPLLSYSATFYVHFDTLKVRLSSRVILALFTAVVLLAELILVLSFPFWSGMAILPNVSVASS